MKWYKIRIMDYNSLVNKLVIILLFLLVMLEAEDMSTGPVTISRLVSGARVWKSSL